MGHLVDQPSPVSKQGVFAWLDLKMPGYGVNHPVMGATFGQPISKIMSIWCCSASLIVDAGTERRTF